MLLFGDEFVERIAEHIDTDGSDRNVDIRHEFAGSLDAQDA